MYPMKYPAKLPMARDRINDVSFVLWLIFLPILEKIRKISTGFNKKLIRAREKEIIISSDIPNPIDQTRNTIEVKKPSMKQ
ncbi:MAG: hypothetical protein ACFFC5_07270 [Promethearchaeota archaeon]